MEAIRGVKVDGVVNTLLELDLVAEAGRKKTLGNPILYATTDKFLNVFGLSSLDELPRPDAVQNLEADVVQQVLHYNDDIEILESNGSEESGK